MRGERRGQAYYNAAYEMNPAVAHLCGTDVDPFYDDNKVGAFIEKLCAPSLRSGRSESDG